MNRRNSSLLLWTIATLVVGVIGFTLLTRGGPTTEAGAPQPGAAEIAGPGSTTATTGPADTATTVPTVDASTDASTDSSTDSTSPSSEPPVGGVTTTSEFKRRPDGTFEPTGAGQSSYPTYPGGDFDDTSPNNVESAGVDENGCDNSYSGACVPPLPQRITCAELGAVNIEVVIGDPQGLDPDGDGLGCDDETIIRTEAGENTPELRD